MKYIRQNRNTTPKTKNGRYLPLKLFIAYIVITLFMFLIGPIKYEYVDKFIVIVFIFAFLLVASIFYYWGVNRRILKQRWTMDAIPMRFLHFCIIYSFLLQLLLVVQNVMAHGFFLSGINSGNFFHIMATTYTDIEVINTGASWIMSYTGCFKIIALIGGSFYFSQIKKTDRILHLGLIFLIVINVMLFVGSQKQLIDLLIYIFIPRYAVIISKGIKIKLSKKVEAIIVIIVAVIFIGNMLIARRNLWVYRYNSTSIVSTGVVDFDHWLFKLFPAYLGMVFTQLISYLSQGYRGLSLCLQLPFVWAYGMGSSFKIMNDISRWLSIPLSTLEVSYPARMQLEFGIRAYAYWHTIFPWLASDFSWVGAVIVVGIFIYFWAKSWRELIQFNNLPAIVLFTHLSVLVMYIPCNNQLFQTRESIVSTIFIILFWFLYHGENKIGSHRDQAFSGQYNLVKK